MLKLKVNTTFCSTGVPLASTRRAPLTFKPLLSTAVNEPRDIEKIPYNFFRKAVIQTGAAVLCSMHYAVAQPNTSCFC